MREREEYIKDIWIEIILRSAKMLDADFTMPHDIARERAFTEVIGRVLDKRESLAAATRVTDEMVERVAQALHEESENPIRGYGRIPWWDASPYWHDKMRRMARAALEVPRDK
jgi:hypothetical protein